MSDFGFLRVSAAMPVVHVADATSNALEIIKMAKSLDEKEASVVVFPELSVTGYTCEDLFCQEKLVEDADMATSQILRETACLRPLLIFGSPVRCRGRLYNCAVVAQRGRILGIVPKTYLAGSGEFYEPRWFESARVLPEDCIEIDYAGQRDVPFGTHQLFKIGRATLAVEICQDLWAAVPPCTWAALSGAQVVVNLSASNEILLKHDYRKSLVSATSSRLYTAYIYCSNSYGESTKDLVWAGSSLIYENGALLAENPRFQRGESYICADVDTERLDTIRAREHSLCYEGIKPPRFEVRVAETVQTDFSSCLLRKIEAYPFVPKCNPEALEQRCSEILSAQVLGLATRLDHIHCKKVVLGISGGLDSTLALLVCALAFDSLGYERGNIIGVSMPGFGTSKRTHTNADDLMAELGVTSLEIPIAKAVRQHFSDIGHDEASKDLTYENSQARERTQILMDLAGKHGGIVVGTGDLSELALGWCTYNGDHMSMYGVNVSVPKTLVRTLVEWAADNKFNEPKTRATLLDIADTPISPELIPTDTQGNIAQKTEDLVGPYELHDFFLYNFFRGGYQPDKILFLAIKAFKGIYDEETIKHWLKTFLRRFFTQQFKRSCLPDGPKVGSVSLSPRGDWRMPSDVESYWKLN